MGIRLYNSGSMFLLQKNTYTLFVVHAELLVNEFKILRTLQMNLNLQFSEFTDANSPIPSLLKGAFLSRSSDKSSN